MEPERLVLVVEDEPAIASLLGLVLGRAGFQTRIARSAAEALHLSAASRFGLAIVDLTLPDSGGLQLGESLRTSSPDLPLIFISGLPCDVPAGTWFLQKPFLPRQILELAGGILPA